MRSGYVVISIGLVACGSGGSHNGGLPDASADAAPPDAAIDASGCQPTVLLQGGTDVVAQGWTVIMQPPATLTSGADFVRLETSTQVNARSGGQLLLSRAGAVEPGKPFALQVVMLVESVANHNQFDAAAAILGSITGAVGTQSDRGEMIYVDRAKLGWSDDSQSVAFAATDQAFHTYELAVDAAGMATVSVDGIARLTRAGYTTTGTIAVGDQTNDAGVDAAMRIRSVTKLCR
jgi:hypothetical protein